MTLQQRLSLLLKPPAHPPLAQQDQLSAPDPWIAQKSAILLVVIFQSFAAYAFIHRVVLLVFLHSDKRTGSFAQAVILLVIFVLLFFMFVWSYVRVVLTPPGFSYELHDISDPPPNEEFPYVSPQHREQIISQKAHNSNSNNNTSNDYDNKVYITNDIDDPHAASLVFPSNTVLDMRYRYCTKCCRIKPLRSHHCRHCGTCVLKMDHHCPWIGQCVGARNYKFFYNFLQWSTLYILFVLISAIISVLPSRRPPGVPHYVDPIKIALAGVAGVFSLFTTTLLFIHTRLILFNVSTIEEISIARLSNTERAKISVNNNIGPLECLKTARVREHLENEWGHRYTEANPWWLGSRRANWEMVMGRKVYRWFLPLHALPLPDSGASYTVNPRLDPVLGQWRKRADWPKELQENYRSFFTFCCG